MGWSDGPLKVVDDGDVGALGCQDVDQVRTNEATRRCEDSERRGALARFVGVMRHQRSLCGRGVQEAD